MLKLYLLVNRYLEQVLIKLEFRNKIPGRKLGPQVGHRHQRQNLLAITVFSKRPLSHKYGRLFALIFWRNGKTEHSSTLACCVWPESHNDLNLLANSDSHSCVCSLELYGSTVMDPSLKERLILLCALFILKRDLWVFKGLRRIPCSNCDALVNKNTWGFLSYLQLFLSLETSVGWLTRICKFLHIVLNHVSSLCRRTKHYLIFLFVCFWCCMCFSVVLINSLSCFYCRLSPNVFNC